MPRQWREFRQNNKAGGERVWKIATEGSQVFVSHGVMGGKMKESSETCESVNAGKSNFKTSFDVAVETALQMVVKKRRNGYLEYNTAGQCIEQVHDKKINFDEDPPKGFRFYKPQKQEETPKGLLEKAAMGRAWYLRKRDGFCHPIVRGTGKPRLYARTFERQHKDEVGTPLTWDDRFPHIIAAAAKVMPFNSIMLGEMVMDRHGKDDMNHVQGVLKSKTEKAIREQIQGGRLSLYIFNIPFWNGENMFERPFRDAMTLIHQINYAGAGDGGPPPLIPVEIFPSLPSPTEAIKLAEENGWEGWVMCDPDGIIGKDGFNFRGKEDRPGEVSSKLKPIYEDDFIVFWDPSKGYGEVSTKDKYKGGVESVALYQYNSKGEMVFIAMCSSGMTDEMKTKGNNPALYPQVWKVKYDERSYTSKGGSTNALRHPRFLEVRTDKKMHECVDERL